MDKTRLKIIPVEELINIYTKNSASDILEEIINRNRKLAHKIAFEYKNSGHSMEDLIQMAYTGLLVAINRFDKEKNNKFSTFAYYCIKGEIQHYIRDNNLINIPRWLQKLNSLFGKFVVDFELRNGRFPTMEEISSGINVSIESIDEILKAREISFYGNKHYRSLDFIDEIIDKSLIKSKPPKSFELVMEDRIIIWDAIDKLKSLNKKIIILKYFLGFSQEEIGQKMGISQRTVSRNIRDSLEKIKENIV